MGVLKRLLAVLLVLAGLVLLTPSPVHAQYEAARGWCENGLVNVITSGLTSANVVQGSYPLCTVTVFVHGGGLATIYSDALHTTPLANPFTAATNGSWLFYAADGRYDVENSGGPALFTMTPFTYLDVLLNTGGGGGGGGVTSLNSLTGAVTITAGSGISVTTVGSAIQIGNTGGGGGGCIPTGGNTAVQTNHPNGTCYGSQDFTWDDTAYNLKAGNGETVTGTYNFVWGKISTVSDSQATTDIAMGDGAEVTATGTSNYDNYSIGDGTNISGIGHDQFAIGDGSLVNSTANLAHGCAITPSDNFAMGNGSQVVAGCDNYVMGDGAGAQHSNNGIALGDGAFITGTDGGWIPTDLYAIGSGATITVTSTASNNGDELYAIGTGARITTTGGSDQYVFGEGTITSSGSVDYVIGSGSIGSTYSNVMLLGLNGVAGASNTLGVGLSATPELLITPGFVEDTGLTASRCVATDSSGRFVSASGGCGGAPAGGAGQVQFYSSGAFGASANFTWDNTNKLLTLGSDAVIDSAPGGSPGTVTSASCPTSWSGVTSTWIPFAVADIASGGNTTRSILFCYNIGLVSSTEPLILPGVGLGSSSDLALADTISSGFGVYGPGASAGGWNIVSDSFGDGSSFANHAGALQWDYNASGNNSPSVVVTPNATPASPPTFDFGVFAGSFPCCDIGGSLAGITDNAIMKFGSIGVDTVPSVVNSFNLGTALLPWKSLKVGPAANETISLQGTNLTANRTVEAPDVSGVLGVITGTPTTTGDCLSVVFSSPTTYHIVDAGVGPCSGSSGTTAALSAITAAAGSNTIANGDNDQEWQWAMTTNSTSAFQFDETTAAAGTGQILLNIHTKATSTAIPFQVTAVGTANGVNLTAAGLFHAIGSGGINATQYKGGTASGTGSCGAAFAIALNDAAAPTCTATVSTAGALIYWNGSAWVGLAGNASGTEWLQETAAGVPSWTTPPGGGNVSNTGTPTANQLAQWTDATHIQGLATVGGGTNPPMVTVTSPNPGDYIGYNNSSVLVNLTPGVTPNARVCSGYTILSSDRGKPIFCSDAGAAAVALPQAGTGAFAGNFYFCIRASGAGTVTVTPTTSTVNGGATLAITTKNYACFYSDNSNYFANTATGF